MATYLITYTGGATPENTTPEQRDAIMKAWMDWFAGLGDAVVDMGNPTGASKVIVPGGVVSDGGPGITGYTIIGADSLDAAANVCRAHPHLEAGGTITVSEAFDVG
jgi:hypothetical protein